MKPWIKEFLTRIDFDQTEIKLQNLPRLMTCFAKHVPFENIDIIQQLDQTINFHNITDKITKRRRGGLCYELNPMFYYVLREIGFRVWMVSATGKDVEPALEGTHIAIILQADEEKYLIDVGYGSHHSLSPLPFSGEVIHSITGDYRITRDEGQKGKYYFEKYQKGELKESYYFLEEAIDEAYLNYVKEIIRAHSLSPFNKTPLITKLTNDGYMTLTNSSLTIIKEGKKTKEPIKHSQVQELSETLFNINWNQ
ncbi:arylamine N-acetyltransferase family protein [Piscibacillus halophilus]|uniref:arylamine N-acetyltransferase family protein n=1 Tax=Piscibacillus halophilus TaxID=571933 RepID=UPI00158F251E|nr:arylamine N-acetyltransferase [Piscibacillus halophilus]